MIPTKVLYINYIYQKGHLNFDRIHIDALIKQADDVKIVLHQKIAEQLPYPRERYALIIPSWLDHDSPNGFINRLFYLATLLYLKIRLPFNDYNKVILSSMEEISLGLISLCRNKHIVCHDNARNWGRGIKGFFLRLIARKNSFIVFNSNMAEPFRKNGPCYHIISHGCVHPYTLDNIDEFLPIDLSHYDTVILHPSNRPNEQFINTLKESASFQEFLATNNILLILRSLKPQENISNNIIYINHYLTFLHYKALFLKSDIILMAYPDDFTYRVSGVSFECVANNKLLLIKKNAALSYCRNYYNYDPIFSDIAQLQERIAYLKNNNNARCIVNSTDLTPDYTQLLLS